MISSSNAGRKTPSFGHQGHPSTAFKPVLCFYHACMIALHCAIFVKTAPSAIREASTLTWHPVIILCVVEIVLAGLCLILVVGVMPP